MQPTSAAAFSLKKNNEQQLILACEIRRRFRNNFDEREIVDAIRSKLSQQNGVHVSEVILLKPGGLPKTTSGKVKRAACRSAFLENTLPSIKTTQKVQTFIANGHPPVALKNDTTTDEIILEIACILSVDSSQMEPAKSINRLGMDSLQVIETRTLLEKKLGIKVPIEALFEDRTLIDLIAYLRDLPASDPVEPVKLLSQAQPNGYHGQKTFINARSSTDTKDLALTQKRGGAAEPNASPFEAALSSGIQARLQDTYRPVKHVLDRARQFKLTNHLREAGLLPYFRPIERNDGPICKLEGRDVVMLGSNNYLGLTTDPRVREAAAQAALNEGPSLTGSRLFNGSTSQHSAFEEKLARFLGHEDALVFTTGYQAVLGAISGLLDTESLLIVDSEVHACIYDAARMSQCKLVRFTHNDPDDLEQKLRENDGKMPSMTVVDGVYSMTGHIAPLHEIRALCDRYGSALMVDDAHSLGVLGATGRGTEEHFGMKGTSDILCGTFSKSLASIGGWVAGKAKTIEWIRFHGRSMLFSASIPPPALAAASTALDILQKEPQRLEQLRNNALYWKNGLQKMGLDTGQTQTPVIPVIIGDDLKCLQLGKRLLEAGVYVNVVIHPAVPQDKALLRTSVIATHEKHHLDLALECFEKAIGLVDA